MSVCVIIPVYKDIDTSDKFEMITLKQGLSILNKYAFYLIGPKSVKWDAYRQLFEQYKVPFNVKIFPDKYFKDLGGYSRLLVAPVFYRSFQAYDYMLIYQTDAFVFRDELQNWCNKDYDFIGAPWFEKFSSTNSDAPFVAGGNGGFSLRKINAHLKVLHSFSYINAPVKNWQKRMSRKLSLAGLIRETCGFLLDLTIRNNTYWLLNSFRGFEDQFWCLVAARNFSWFRMPDYKEAMNFAIEMQPHRVFKINNHQLPFGCHAWWKYDLDFWKPYIANYGYKL